MPSAVGKDSHQTVGLDHRRVVGVGDDDRQAAQSGAPAPVIDDEIEGSDQAVRLPVGLIGRRHELLERHDVVACRLLAADQHLAGMRQSDDAHRERIVVRVGRPRQAERGRPGRVVDFELRDGSDHRRPVRRTGIEVERLRAERAEDVRLLPIVGRLQDGVADAAEEEAELEARDLEMRQQRLREGAVVAAAVFGDLVGAGGHDDDRVARHRVDPRQALLHRCRASGDAEAARHPVDERIVAAGVEQQDADLLGLRHLAEEELERQRLIDQVALPLELGVGRQQVVLVVDLDAMAGIEDQRRVRLLSADAEGTERPSKRALVGVVGFFDLEIEMPQRLGDPTRVVDRVRQGRARTDTC